LPKLLRYAALAIALIAALMWMKHERDVDSCLDNGGRWDDAANACVPAAPASGSRTGQAAAAPDFVSSQK
jgi:hypothetical protein